MSVPFRAAECHAYTCRVPEDRLAALKQKTRYDPSEVETRVFREWERAGIFHPEPEGSRPSIVRPGAGYSSG